MAIQRSRSAGLNGLPALAYVGVLPSTPTNFFIKQGAPTTNDYRNVYVGDLWLDNSSMYLSPSVAPTVANLWILVSVTAHVATWRNFGMGQLETLTGNTGGPVSPDGANNINVVGDAVTVNIVGNPGTHTLTVSTVGTGVVNSLTGDSGGAVFPTAGNINVIAGTASRTSGETVTFIGNPGSSTLTLNVTDANSNTLVGKSAGSTSVSGGNSTALGAGSLTLLSSGSNSTAIGWAALASITTQNGCTAVGSAALQHCTGANNTAFGDSAASSLGAGTGGVYIGANAGSALTSTESNQVLINHAGVAGANNWIVTANGNGDRFVTTDMVDNQFVGINSGNTTVSGVNNTVFGAGTLRLVSSAGDNCIFGNNIMTTATTTGSSNLIMGSSSFNIGTGSNNCIGGKFSATVATTASANTFYGNSTAYDSGGGVGLTTGTQNIALGYTAGSAWRSSESNNLYIGIMPGVAAESNTVRIGNTSSAYTKTFIEGIRGITTVNNNAIAVLIDSAGQLGTVSSSARYKENIEDMGSYSNVVYKLRPVTFNYKKHSAKDISVGLVAEEVAVQDPRLVVYDKDGIPETVKYHDLPVLLLNEIQRLNKELERHCKVLADRDSVMVEVLTRVRLLEENSYKKERN